MVEIFNHWNVKPFSLSKANEYLEDLNDLRFSDSGLVTEANPFFFVNESCQLLANSVNLIRDCRLILSVVDA